MTRGMTFELPIQMSSVEIDIINIDKVKLLFLVRTA